MPPSALEHQQEIFQNAGRPVFFLDYDGTLTPIVDRPEDANLSDEMRGVLCDLAQVATVAIVSGRDRADVEQRVGLENLYYAGSHGFDISGPGGVQMQHEQGQKYLPELDRAEESLQNRLAEVPGAQVERKRFALAVHYRRADKSDVARIEAAVDEALATSSHLRKRGGKMIFELLPDIEWDKGRAVWWLLEALPQEGQGVTEAQRGNVERGRQGDQETRGQREVETTDAQQQTTENGQRTLPAPQSRFPDLHPLTVPVYFGDDLTDEDAFAALAERGLGILVADAPQETRAHYHLRDVAEMQQFLHAWSVHLATG